MGNAICGGELERIDSYNPQVRRNIAVNYHPAGGTSRHHTHDFYEINLVLAGEAVNEVSGRASLMRQGDGILLHPGAFHTVRAAADSQILNVLIRPEWMLSVLASVDEGALLSFAERADTEDYLDYILFFGAQGSLESAARLVREAAPGVPQGEMAAEGALLLFLADLSRCAERALAASPHQPGYRRFAAILSYAYENAPALSVRDLAARFGYSPAHLTRLFRQYIGETPAALLQRLRLERAAKLLWEGEAPVFRVAEACGFPSAPYFHRLFKKSYGVTPEGYRQGGRGPLALEEK